jgi:hypothetical protein
MCAFLVFEKVVSAVEASLVTFARAKWAGIVVSFRAVDFPLVALQACFVTEGFV